MEGWRADRALWRCSMLRVRAHVWIREHVLQAIATGQLFPRWDGPRGARRTHLRRADRMLPDVSDEDDARTMLAFIWQQPPLALSAAARRPLACADTVSIHLWLTDLARFINRHPDVPFALPARLQRTSSGASTSRTGGRWATGSATPTRWRMRRPRCDVVTSRRARPARSTGARRHVRSIHARRGTHGRA